MLDPFWFPVHLWCIQENFRVKGKKLYFGMVLREVVRWAVCELSSISGEHQKLMQKAVRWPCGVCGRGVGSNSIKCTSCQKGAHRSACVSE